MPTIKFTDTELEYLRASYLAELKEATDYMDEIRRLLAKLGNSAKTTKGLTSSVGETKERKRPGRPKKNKSTPAPIEDIQSPVTKKKRGRPAKEKGIDNPKQKVRRRKAKKKDFNTGK